jgi:hypothetical protein
MILSVPSTGNRYFLMQLLDMWTNVFACPGTRTTGNRKADFAVTGPNWKGSLPQGVLQIKAPTNFVLIVGRTMTKGKDDYPAVHAIQDQYRLTPLSAWGKDYVPPQNLPVENGIDTKTPPFEQLAATMDAGSFFSRLNALMKANPPAAADAGAMKRFSAIGVSAGRPFDLKSVDIEGVEALNRGIQEGFSKIKEEAAKPQGRQVNGWDIMYDLGRYKTNYLLRAVVAMIGLGANLPEDALYPRATRDAEGQPLVGSNRYIIRFPNDQLPPVGAFWSLTMYNAKHRFEKNTINRYAIGDRDKLKFEPDGSLTLYIQNQSPGSDKEANWLPAPAGAFNLSMRLYSPKKEVLDGTWKPPAVKRESAVPGARVA